MKTETVKCQLSKENIKFVKSTNSFSKCINSALDIIRTDEKLLEVFQNYLSTLNNLN